MKLERPGHARQTHGLALLLAGLLLDGCVDPLDQASAYASQRFLCTEDREAEWNELIAACDELFRADASCAGVASFSGELQGQPYVVESLLDDCSVQDVRAEDGALIRDAVRLFGTGPYFGFRVSLEGLGGAVVAPASPQEPRALDVVGREGAAPLYDEETTLELRVNTRGASLELAAPRGEVVVDRQTTDSQGFRISAELTQGGTLDGCFHVRPTSYEVAEIADE